MNNLQFSRQLYEANINATLTIKKLTGEVTCSKPYSWSMAEVNVNHALLTSHPGILACQGMMKKKKREKLSADEI